MCGIAGVLNGSDKPVDTADLRTMAQALAHRGPDDEGFHVDGNLGLAHRRLAILDLTAAGRQPMCNEDGSVWIVYNGQLYGFQSARDWLTGRGHRFRSRTDTEVLIHMYEEKGEGLLDGLDGMFAFALWDARRRRLLLARDRLGIKPLYYLTNGSDLFFASELKALLALPRLPRRLDPLGLAHFLYQSSAPNSTCILRDYQKLGPGELLIAEAGELHTKRYWTLPPPDQGSIEPARRAAETLKALLKAAVESHLVADVPVGAFLSGGLDSSAVTLEARRRSAEAFHTFSVRFVGPKALDEGPAAGAVATALGTTHHELVLGPDCVEALPAIVRQADEPFAISSALALYHLSRFAREHVKVALTGDGADEILAGYPWRHEPELGRGAGLLSLARGLALTWVRSLRGARAGGPSLRAQLRSRLGRMFTSPAERYAEIVAAFAPEELISTLSPDLAEIALQAWNENPVRLRYAEEADTDETNRRLRVDIQTTLGDEMLTKVDRMTMAWGLEARVPFLDRTLVEWALRLPGRQKVRNGRGKLVLREALRAELPRTSRRRKHGFDMPLGAWLRGPLRGLLQDVLSAPAVRRRGLLDPEAVERLLAAHLEGRGDYSRKLFSLLTLEMWLEHHAPEA